MRVIFIFMLIASLNLKGQEPMLKNGLQSFAKTYTIYPMYSRENCIQGEVEVAFKLNQYGQVTYATVTKGVGADLDAEALRLIKLSSGKWQMPVNYDTTYLVRSPMKFSLQDYGCENINPASVGLAIKHYADKMKSVSKITNFYSNSEQDTPNLIEESEIIALKNELGIDDDFLNKKMVIAEKKIKQGDLQSACEDFKFVKHMGSTKADKLLAKYCQ